MLTLEEPICDLTARTQDHTVGDSEPVVLPPSFERWCGPSGTITPGRPSDHAENSALYAHMTMRGSE